jgi:hypothetical protein
MDASILTPDFLARHLQYKAAHDQSERLYHLSRDTILEAMGARFSLTRGLYSAVIKPHERRTFNSKTFQLEHPALYEEFLRVTLIRQLIVTGPPAQNGEMQQEEAIPKTQPPHGSIRSLIAQHLGSNEELIAE